MGYIKKRSTLPKDEHINLNRDFKPIRNLRNHRYDKDIEVAAAFGTLYNNPNLEERVDAVVDGDTTGEKLEFIQKVEASIPRHVVTFSCTHGSVGATVDGMGIQSGAYVITGKSVVFTITPDEGYTYSGTNPETVLVNADVTKAYECTAVVVVKPAIINLLIAGDEVYVARAQMEDNPHEGTSYSLPTGWTHAYAWSWRASGNYPLLFSSSDYPTISSAFCAFSDDQGYFVPSDISIEFASPGLGSCVSAYAETIDACIALYSHDGSPLEGFEGEWIEANTSGPIYYTESATPVESDILCNSNGYETGEVFMYSNIEE